MSENPTEAPSELIALARDHHQAGRLAEAGTLYRQVLATHPDHFDALHLLGVLSFQSGDVQQAISLVQTALQQPAHPAAALAANNLGNFLWAAGQPDEALAAYRQAITLKPDLAPAHLAVAQIYREQQNLPAAIASFQQALNIAPAVADTHCQLALTYQLQGRLADALASYQQARVLDADLPHIDFNIGLVLHDLGHLPEAASSYQRALLKAPDLVDAAYNLAVVYQTQGQRTAALTAYDQVLAMQPTHAEALFNRALLRHESGDFDAAIADYRQMLNVRPGDVGTLFNLGNLYRDLARDDEALACYRQALQREPANDKVLLNQGVVLRNQGRLAEAIASYRQAIAANPAYDGAYSNLLFSLAHDENADPVEVFAEHLAFGRRFDRGVDHALAPASHSLTAADRQRRLKVGLVSGDLRQHPVALYLEPLLAAIDPAQIELFAYANQSEDDATSRRLQGICAHWRTIAGLADGAVVDLIRQDAIDILIDLSGHTSAHRLQVFTYKPAPVQATWVGYFGSTGLAAIDYLLADTYLAPSEVADRLASEKIIRLPAVACFQPPATAPAINPLPALSNGFLTFASFNRVSKLGEGVIARWSRVLHAASGSRLLLGAIPDAGVAARLRQSFARHGIAGERLEFHGNASFAAYLALHQRVDILLDTYPFAGGATSNYALWMGVPILTLAGDSLLSRQGAALLQHVGIKGFCADNEAEFLANAEYWRDHLDELAALRAGLRERCQASLLQQPQRVARAFEHAMRLIWQRHCDGLPAAAISVPAGEA